MHSVGLPRTCLSFTNFAFFFMGSIGCFICLWCAINSEFFRDVNYTITKSTYVGVIANFMSLRVWVTPVTTIIIPITVITMLTSCCGILGAGCKIQCAIKSYICLVTLISGIAFWIFFISGIYNIYMNNQNTAATLRSYLQKYYGQENDFMTYFWNILMLDHKCCGVTSYYDFENSYWKTQNPELFYPVQCCELSNQTALIPVSPNCTKTFDGVQNHINFGCFDALRDVIGKNKRRLIVYVVLLAIAYVLVMFFAMCIMKNEPLLARFALQGAMPSVAPEPPKKIDKMYVPERSQISLQNMVTEEPPMRVMKVVSRVNPYQTYKLSANYIPSNQIVYPLTYRNN